ncbi:MAG: sulfurtransferase complex subunit TusB [Gammaproteobacteria bacterium]|nr:sulfurtransferase complex subunit TusB [Gammaproteobacteria bacterium]
MASLHTVNHGPNQSNALQRCLRLAEDGSALLLLEDGVYAALAANQAHDPLREHLVRLRVYVLEPDLLARGLVDCALATGIERVDYDEFVQLAARCERVVSWN